MSSRAKVPRSRTTVLFTGCEARGSFSSFEIGDPPKEYELKVVAFWKSLPNALREHQYELKNGSTVTVRFDPGRLHVLLKRRADVRDQILAGNVADRSLKVFWREARLALEIEFGGRRIAPRHRWHAQFFAETYLYDLFLISNLALPACANFNSVRVHEEGKRPNNIDRLELGNFYFEHWLHKRTEWPTLRVLDVSKVTAWYRQVRAGFAQVPQSSIERALFALLHLCRSDGRPEDIVWIFYAFESLMQTRPGENFSALVERISLVLEAEERDQKLLKSRLRKLYEYRSSFVHGGLQVVHPMHWEVMDSRVESEYSRLLALTTWGVRVLIACLQNYAVKGWTHISFRSQTRIEQAVPPDVRVVS